MKSPLTFGKHRPIGYVRDQIAFYWRGNLIFSATDRWLFYLLGNPPFYFRDLLLSVKVGLSVIAEIEKGKR